MDTFAVSLPPGQAAEIVKEYVMREGMSTECIGEYRNRSPEGKTVYLLVFEKYFMRNSSRASLSIVIEDIAGRTVVSAVGSGGGQGAVFRFDWGAADSFSSLASRALQTYRV